MPAYAFARSAAVRPRAAYHCARLVPAAPPNDTITSPPAAWSERIDWLIATAWSLDEVGASAARPAQAGVPSGAAWMKPSVTSDSPRVRAMSTRFGTGQAPMST